MEQADSERSAASFDVSCSLIRQNRETVKAVALDI